jgi:hypothetical protein
MRRNNSYLFLLFFVHVICVIAGLIGCGVLSGICVTRQWQRGVSGLSFYFLVGKFLLPLGASFPSCPPVATTTGARTGELFIRNRDLGIATAQHRKHMAKSDGTLAGL